MKYKNYFITYFIVNLVLGGIWLLNWALNLKVSWIYSLYMILVIAQFVMSILTLIFVLKFKLPKFLLIIPIFLGLTFLIALIEGLFGDLNQVGPTMFDNILSVVENLIYILVSAYSLIRLRKDL